MPCFEDLGPLTVGLPKMTILSDVPWGPVERICEGFIKTGLDVTLLCLNSKTRFYAEHIKSIDANIMEITDNRRSLFTKYLALAKMKLSQFPHRPTDFENAFFDVNLGINLAAQPHFAGAGLVFICNAPGLVDWPAARTNFSGKAVVWRLTCSAGYTGFCGYTAGCERWKTDGCNHCPQLGDSADGSDIAHDMFSEKLESYAGSTMAITTPSAWLGRCVRESCLLGSFPHATIPSSVSLDTYAPQARHEARDFFSLPRDAKIILYGSGSFRKNKGFHLLCEALVLLREQWHGNPPLLCFFGKGAPEEILPQGYSCVNLGYFDDVVKLANAYAAADVFVSPSFQDNLPNTVNEAIACGTPVVCFNKFSSEDVVLDGVTGYTAEHPGLPFAADGSWLQNPAYSVSPDSLADLAAKIQKLITMPSEEYEGMRVTCREKAQEFFSPVLQAARYLRLYRRLLELPEVRIAKLPE